MSALRTLQRSAAVERAAPQASDDLLARVNAFTRARLTADDVYIRSMYLCSDQVCEADWLRFTPAALEQIATRVPGTSVLAGHNRQSLPLARFFHAAVGPRDDAPGTWVRAWFYWLRDTAGAYDLVRNIDGGIYREVSISWRYRDDRCSLCGAGRHACEHQPGETYGQHVCHRVVQDIVDVLEGSLVYRGADVGACVAGAHAAGAPSATGTGLFGLDAETLQSVLPLWDPVQAPATVQLADAVPAGWATLARELGLAVHWHNPPAPDACRLAGIALARTCDALPAEPHTSVLCLAADSTDAALLEQLAAELPARCWVFALGDDDRAVDNVLLQLCGERGQQRCSWQENQQRRVAARGRRE